MIETLHKTKCDFCDTMIRDYEVTQNGEHACYECYESLCPRCESNTEPYIDTGSEYICDDCAQSAGDWAMDAMKDGLYD